MKLDRTSFGKRLGSYEAAIDLPRQPIVEGRLLRMVGLVEHMTRQVIQRELKTDSRQIEQVLREGLKLLPMGAENIRLFINPQDFDQIKALRERHDEHWKILEDESLQPGGCRIETEHSRIDASMETRITQAIAQLFDQLHEQNMHPAPADINIDLEAPDEA